MPRKNPLSERERQISGRLKAVRMQLGKSRVEFARALNLDSSIVSNLENGRIRLRFFLAVRLGEQFAVSLRWLAEGVGDMWGFQPVAPMLRDDSRPFSVVYDAVIRPELAQRDELAEEFRKLKVYPRFNAPLGSGREERDLQSILHILKQEQASIPPGLRAAYHAAVVRAAKEFAAGHYQSSMEGLTDVSLKGKKGSMQSELSRLLARIKTLTQARGAKSRLAKFLGVQPARITEWLSGKKEPGGETTLRLIRWVGQQERE